MGIIKNQVLGDVSGSVGHIVFKQRGNTCFIAPKPKGYSTPQDPKSCSIRNQFWTISKLASSINKIDLIKKLWKQEFPDCYSAYHKLLTSNYHLFNGSDLSGTPVLFPHPGFKLPDASIEIQTDKLILNSGPFTPDAAIDFNIEKSVIIVTVLIIKSCEDPEARPGFFHKKGEKILLENKSSLQLINNLNWRDVILTDKFFIYRSWSALITLDEKNNPVHYSEVISFPDCHSEGAMRPKNLCS